MRVRALDANNDMTWGKGQADFYRDQPEAPAQCVKTRLGEYLGDWFLDTSAGTRWRTDVLGYRTAATRDPMIRARILGTQGVTAITAYASQVDRNARGFSGQATISTAYGETVVAVPTSLPNGDVRSVR